MNNDRHVEFAKPCFIPINNNGIINMQPTKNSDKKYVKLRGALRWAC
jgi:hypothetical protein